MGRVVKVKPDRGGGRAAAEQPRPRREVRQVEQRVGVGKPICCGEDRRVGGAGAAGDDRADIAEHRGAQLVGELFEILVPDGQASARICGPRERMSAKLSVANDWNSSA